MEPSIRTPQMPSMATNADALIVNTASENEELLPQDGQPADVRVAGRRWTIVGILLISAIALFLAACLRSFARAPEMSQTSVDSQVELDFTLWWKKGGDAATSEPPAPEPPTAKPPTPNKRKRTTKSQNKEKKQKKEIQLTEAPPTPEPTAPPTTESPTPPPPTEAPPTPEPTAPPTTESPTPPPPTEAPPTPEPPKPEPPTTEPPTPAPEAHAQRSQKPQKLAPEAPASLIWPPDGSSKHCRPDNGNGMQLRVRREIYDWTDEEFEKYKVAFGKALQHFDANTVLHVNAHDAHGSDEFLPFHRRFLHDFETAIQKEAEDCDLTLPFWNWAAETGTLSQSIVWNTSRFGPLASGCVREGIGANHDIPPGLPGAGQCVYRDPLTHWFWNTPQVDGVLPDLPQLMTAILAEDQYSQMREVLEVFHGELHCLIHGTMCDFRSPADAIFYMHHGFVDRVWWMWQMDKSDNQSHSTCGQCNTLSDYDHVPAADYVGTYDTDLCCVKYPPADPTTCLRYGKDPNICSLGDDRRLYNRRSRLRKRTPGTDEKCTLLLEQIDSGECSLDELRHIKGIAGCAEHVHRSVPLVAEWFNNMQVAGHMGRMHGNISKTASSLMESYVKQWTKAPTREATSRAENQTCMDCDFVCQGGRRLKAIDSAI